MRWVAYGLLASLLAAGCSTPIFVCSSDDSCNRDGGQCEADGFCSFPDNACDSGRRYSEFAGDGLSGTCVDATGGSSSSTTAVTTTTSTGTSGTSETGSTGDNPLPSCGDGVLDDGELCDDGNTADGDGCNADCTPSGMLRWEAVSDIGMIDDKTYSVAEHPETGDVWAAGYTGNADGDWTWLTVQLDRDGSLLSTEFTDEGTHSFSLGLTFDGGGNRIEAGVQSGDRGVLNGVVRRFGDDPWTWTMSPDEGCGGRLDDVHVDDDGTIYAAGRKECEMSSAPYLVALEPGVETPKWEFEGQSLADTMGYQLSVAVADSDSLFLAASTLDNADDRNMIVYEVSKSGGAQWSGSYGTPMADDRAGAIAVTADGTLAVGGTHGQNNQELWIGQFQLPESEPTRTWTDRGDGAEPLAQWAHSVIAVPDGGFVVAGYLRMEATGDDSFVARYSADGDVVWRDVRDFDGSTDRIFGLDLAEDGDILASGYSEAAAGNRRFLVLRYSP